MLALHAAGRLDAPVAGRAARSRTIRRRSCRAPCWPCATPAALGTVRQRSPRVPRRSRFRTAGGEPGLRRAGPVRRGRPARPSGLRRRRAAGRAELPAAVLPGLVRRAARRRAGRAAVARSRRPRRTRSGCSPRGRRKWTILRYAVKENPTDAQAHLQLGCLLANSAASRRPCRRGSKAAELRRPSSSIAWRNLGLAPPRRTTWPRPKQCYRKAIAARPERPDALPRPGRDPDRRRAAARGHPAAGDDAAGRHAAGRDHRDAGPGVRRRAALRRLHQAAGSRRPTSSTGKGRTSPGGCSTGRTSSAAASGWRRATRRARWPISRPR